jgi:hypothetical protein
MKFALVCGKRTEATKGARGVCPNSDCNSELIAKCGKIRTNYWAHKSKRNCDAWWEPETEWHRSWKNNFPSDWQEIVLSDELTSEKHIADVRTKHGLVIEFQHSHIDPDERTLREKFYKNMIWVVDGTRLKRDYPRFLEGKNQLRSTNMQGIFLIEYPDQCFPSIWLGGLVPVIFDFRGTEPKEGIHDLSDKLYCLFPKNRGVSKIVIFSRESFIINIKNGTWFKKRPEPDQNKNQQEPQNQITKQLTGKYGMIRLRTGPQLIYERGRWRKRYPRL